MTRVYPAVAAANIRDALERVRSWIDRAGRGEKVHPPSERDRATWKAAQEVLKNA